MRCEIDLTFENIVARKDILKLEMATENDIRNLLGDVPRGYTRAVLTEWYVIKHTLFGSDESFFVLGRPDTPHSTSAIVRLSQNFDLVRTENSLYCLGGLEARGQGNPCQDLMVHLAWRFGSREGGAGYDLLGIPRIEPGPYWGEEDPL